MRSAFAWVLGLAAGFAVLDWMPDRLLFPALPLGALVVAVVVTVVANGPRTFLRMFGRSVRPLR